MGMRVLHVYNRQRGGGGAGSACEGTISASVAGGVEVARFARDSKNLNDNLRGRVQAFMGGIYGRSAANEFVTVLREFRPDVVHAHELYPLISPWIFPRCTAARIPVVMSCYDYRLTCPIATHFQGGHLCHRCLGGREYWAFLENCRSSLPASLGFALRSWLARRKGLVTRHVSRFLVLSEFSKRWLIEKAELAPERVIVNAPTFPIPESPVPEPAAGRYIGFTGRSVAEKGLDVLLAAAKKARLPVKVAWSSPVPLVADRGSSVSFELTDSHEKLAAFYRGARVVVMPSLWRETFGIVAAEAMSHGIPIIASRIGALPELVEDEVTGLLFGTGDWNELADKLLRVWNDRELCRRLGAAARHRAVDRCSQEVHFGRLMEVYRDILGAPDARSRASVSPEGPP